MNTPPCKQFGTRFVLWVSQSVPVWAQNVQIVHKQCSIYPLWGGGILGFPIKKSSERVIKICRVKTKKYICMRFAHWQKCVVFEISVVG